MDEKPLNNASEPEVNSTPEQPIEQQTVEEVTKVVTEEPSTASEEVVINQTEATVSSAPAPKKNHKKFLGILIAGIMVLGLIIGFAVFALVKNQPKNIALESFNNLINAKQLAISGTVDINPGENTGIGPIAIRINSETSNSNQSNVLGLTVNHPEVNEPIELEFGEVMMSDGVFYIKTSGLKKIYDNILSKMLKEYQTQQSISNLNYNNVSAYEICEVYEDVNTYLECLEQVEENLSTSNQSQNIINQINSLSNYIDNIIQKIDNQWFRISLEEILNSDLISNSISQSNRDEWLKNYNCVIGITKNISNYTQEYANLYEKNQFIDLTAADDSYYKVSVAPEPLANFANATSQTKLVNDLAACVNVDLSQIKASSISSEEATKSISEMPDIYAKFTGFLTHHLTDLKINYDKDGIKVASNLSFSYPAGLEVTAPADARPIMDTIKEVMQELNLIK